MNLFILHLSLIKGIGPVTISYLIEKLEANGIVDLYALTLTDLQRLGISAKQAQIIREGLQESTLLEKELEQYKKYSIEWCTYKDDQYPTMLKFYQV